MSDFMPTLRLVDGAGDYGDPIPGWSSLEIGGDVGEQLVLKFSIDPAHESYAMIQHGGVVAVLLNGQELQDSRFTVDQSEEDEVEHDGMASFTGDSTLFQLNYALVYAESWDVGAGGNVTTPGHGFASQTPGQALRELLEAAQARGWWTGLTWDFNDTLDSSGAAWSANIDEFIEHGRTLLDVVKMWKQRQVCVARMDGDVLQLFKYDTQGEDLTQDVILLRGVDLTEGPVRRSSRDSISVLLAVTEDFGVEEVDAPALSQFGRREGFLSQTSVEDESTLTAIAQNTMALKARQREAFTYGLQGGQDRPLPFVSYDRGDQIQLHVKGEDRRVMRVRQLSVEWNQNGEWTGSAAFGDRLMDAEEQLALRLEQITRGSMDGGVSGQPILGPFEPNPTGGGGGSPDTLIPKAPTGLSATSSPVFEPPGSLYATVVLSWVAPTQNVDNSGLVDLGSFDIQYKPTAGTVWEPAGQTDKADLDIAIPRLLPTVSYGFRVRARDIWGNVSAWSSTLTYTPATDTAPPTTVPSTPAVTPFLYQGLLITWDGKNNAGGAIQNDARHVEVHVSTTNGFTPGPTTLKDTIPVPGGSVVVSGLTAGTLYRVKFVLIDWAGNVGATASAQASGTPESVDGTDIADGAVTETKLANLAVTNAKIADLSATKITAGTMSAIVTVSGTFRTASSGQRVEFTSAGIKLYDASNNVVINMDASTGQGTFNGVLGTAQISGSVLVDGTSGSRVTITNQGGIPLVALQTGRLIEKYPGYIFASNNSFLRNLQTQIHSPGTLVAGMPSTSFVTSIFQLDTVMQDGDYNNATTLASVVHGNAKFVFPQFNNGSNIFTNSPQISLRSHTRGAIGSLTNPMTDPGKWPGITFYNSENPQKLLTLQLEPNGAAEWQCVLAVRRTGGDNVYTGVNADGFATIPCHSMYKTDIGPLPVDALEVIRNNPSLTWRRKTDIKMQFGPMADNLPEEVAPRRPDSGPGGQAIELGSMTGLLWKAVEMLLDRVERLEASSVR